MFHSRTVSFNLRIRDDEIHDLKSPWRVTFPHLPQYLGQRLKRLYLGSSQ